MKENQSCSTCIFWLGTDGAGGECRRYPAQIVLIQEVQEKLVAIPGQLGRGQMVPEVVRTVKGFFPMMLGSDVGCGEHREDYSRDSI